MNLFASSSFSPSKINSATNQDLESAIEKSDFREDLFYRLNVVQLEIPPLRTRGNDILLLARHFVKKFPTRLEKLLHVLKTLGNNRTLAARILGMDRKTLYWKMQRYGVGQK